MSLERVRRAVRRRVELQRERFRRRGREALLWSLRLTVAAVASYLVALAMYPGGKPLLAPLTAMLVVQATPVSLLVSGVDRVVSVVAGVLLAVGFSAVTPLTWWSLALIIAASILIGQALRLRSNLIEVPISAMLVLGVRASNADVAAWHRISETLVGAAVGVLANLLFPPKVATASAAEAIRDLSEEQTRLLNTAADQLLESEGHGDRIAERATAWLDRARSITHDIPAAGAALIQAEEGRRLNVRALRSPNAGPGLRQGLETLEHSAVTLRGLFRAIHDATHDPAWPDDDVGRAVAGDLSEVLREVASAVDAFGELVRSEAVSVELSAPEQVEAVATARQGLQNARELLADRLTSDHGLLLGELYAAASMAVRRLLGEMDLEARASRLELLRPVRRPVTPLALGRRSRG